MYETFSKALMASENVQSYLGSTKFQVEDEFAVIHDGALVVLGEPAPNDTYNLDTRTNKDVKDYNVFLSKAPEADTDDVVIVDIADISKGDIMGNTYTMGVKLHGLYGRPGQPVRYRVPVKHDKFWLSDECFVSEPTVGEYATATANDTHHTPTNTKKTDGYCVKILAAREFTVGNGAIGKLYLCQVQ